LLDLLTLEFFWLRGTPPNNTANPCDDDDK
jgi:hypothetical protein